VSEILPLDISPLRHSPLTQNHKPNPNSNHNPNTNPNPTHPTLTLTLLTQFVTLTLTEHGEQDRGKCPKRNCLGVGASVC